MSVLSDPAANAVIVVPSDVLNLGPASRALYVGGSGNLTVLMLGGQTVLFSNLAPGWYPLRVTRVMLTGTTATNIVSVW
jgi:hypothetical protein